MTDRSKRIAIVGGGPIGLEAAVYAVSRGFDAHLFEKHRIAENVRQWGHVRLFSPFGLNASPWGIEAVAGSQGTSNLPQNDELLTGREFVARYLAPLSRLPQLEGRIHTGSTVHAIGRSRTWKGDSIGSPGRGLDPFQLLIGDGDDEQTFQADYVIDCSGTYPHHNWIGAGGIPCVGERRLLTADDYGLPDILGEDRLRFAGLRTLVIGGGYSAATAVTSLAKLCEAEPQTKVFWITRSPQERPIEQIADDPLPERDRVADAANRLAVSADSPVNWLPGRIVQRIGRVTGGSEFVVTAKEQGPCPEHASVRPVTEELVVDRVVANVGYRPDRNLYRELQVHECYATEGPIKLAGVLLGETSNDCLDQSATGPETLVHPEPNLFIIGAKSYARDSRFLLKLGHEQIRDVFSLIAAGSDSTATVAHLL